MTSAPYQQIKDAAASTTASSEKLNQFIHGAAGTSVATDNGAVPAIATIAQTFGINAEDAVNAAETARVYANYVGTWSSLSGALNIPASVFHNGDYWRLVSNVANVAANEPSDVSAVWTRLDADSEPVANKLARRRPSGAVAAVGGVLDDELISVLQKTKLNRAITKLLKWYNNDDSTYRAQFGDDVYHINDEIGGMTDIHTFTRASEKTVIDNASGLLVTVPANEPAFSYSSVFGGRKPLTIHGQRTNVARLNQLDTETLNATASYSSSEIFVGGLQALVTEVAAENAYHGISRPQNFTETDPITRGWLIKDVSARYITVGSRPSLVIQSETAVIDLQEGVVLSGFPSDAGASGLTVLKLGDGSCLITAQFAPQLSGSRRRIGVGFASPDGSARQYTSSGGRQFIVYNVDMSVGTLRTLPIIHAPTSEITRAADICTIDTLAPWFNPSEFTVVVDLETAATGELNAFSFSDNTSNNRIQINKLTTNWRVLVTGGNFNIGEFVAGRSKLALRYKNGVVSACVNGGTVNSLAATANPTLFNRFIIGSNFSASDRYLNGSINFLDYKPFAVSDEQLIEWSTI